MSLLKISMVFGIMCLYLVGCDPQTPVWPASFTIGFLESYDSSGNPKIGGKMWYDSTKKMSRVDRVNAFKDQICSGIIPNVLLQCTHLVRDGKRWVYFPQRRQCCMCCDASHGCGILNRNWLDGATYAGRQTLDGGSYDKWVKYDGQKLNYYWASPDSRQVPKRLVEGELRYKDFLVNSYQVKAVDPIVFNLPSYCTSDCSATVCKKFRQNGAKVEMLD